MNNKVIVKVLVNKDIATVWKAWTSPDNITKWNFASDEWHCPNATNDLVEGGMFSYRMEAKDGSMGFDYEGTYDNIDKHNGIEFSLSDGRQVGVRFNAIETGIEITESFDPDTSVSIDMQQAGWQSILNNFKKYVEDI